MSGNKKAKKPGSKKAANLKNSNSKKQLAYKPSKSLIGQSFSSRKKRTNNKKNKFVIIGLIVIVAVVAIIIAVNHKSYEEYDLKGLTIKEACEKARGAGWEVNSVTSREGNDKTDCYNDTLTVTYYEYKDWSNIGEGHKVYIYFGEKKTEEEKQAECEASGKWYRNSQCKTQEEWENDYAWSNAHAACKKYGSSGYAKTLTDCYVGSEYKGPVSGEATVNSTNDSASSGSSSNTSNASWRQVLSDYEKWMDSYIDFMKRYKNADSSAIGSMLSDYSRLVNEMTEWSKKLNNISGGLSTSDLAEYVQTLARINKKMEELY